MTLGLWLQSKHHNQLWYIGTQAPVLDDRLCEIQPPNEIQRTPRSLQTTLKFWKGQFISLHVCALHSVYLYYLYILPIAHELRAWLLHYSPVVLHGILPDQYYNHHVLLVEGVYLLLKGAVSEEDLHQSSQLLKHYCFLFAPLYGIYMYMLAYFSIRYVPTMYSSNVINIHTHAPLCVYTLL